MRFLPLALTALVVTPALAAAQQGERGRGQMPANAPFALEGPPAQEPKYAALRTSYMTSTRTARDSVRALRERMRATMASGGDREAARALMAPMRDQATALNQRYEDFESELGFLLDAAQTAKFEAWKEKERARLMEERRGRRGGR